MHPLTNATPDPNSWLDTQSLDLLRTALERLGKGFQHLPPTEARGVAPEQLDRVLQQVADRLQDNYPYFHPLYAGQMLKPPHPVARLAYMLALWINPNNHALDGGRASSAMEKEAVSALARMFGWRSHLGHLTSGGTMANLEALWVAGRLHPGKTIVASAQAHYTHRRISRVLGLEFESIPCDRTGRIEVSGLEKRLQSGDVGTVVGTVGTTATGAVDPLAELLALRPRYGFRLHVDAAYGGYFVLADNLAENTRAALARIGEADSIVIDPHKHGLQPYGCGCVLFADPTVGRFYRHDSPYTYFSSTELHLGEISLECSRPGASAVALWATQQLLPLERGGEFAAMLTSGRAAALDLYGRLARDARFLTMAPPELDIVAWTFRAKTVTEASRMSERLFRQAAQRHLHLALASLPVELFDLARAHMERDADTMRCVRSVLMKPEHCQWLDRLWAILDEAARDLS